MSSRNDWLNTDALPQTGYGDATPFPHIVIDHVLSPEAFKRLSSGFPGPDKPIWLRYKSGKENRKLQSQNFEDLPTDFQDLINYLNGPVFTSYLERLTGIQGLIPDAHLFGGGLHQSLPRAHLGLHIDYNKHPTLGLDRRLNAILYLNEDWEDAWGGHLELWDADAQTRVQRIAPIGNRLIIFNTDERSWHGHPDPLACPPGRTRKSVALYYYTNGRDDVAADGHNTVFRERPGEVFKPTLRERVGRAIRAIRR